MNLRTPDSTLSLLVMGFSLCAIAFTGLTTLIVTAAHERSARFLARYGRYLILGYAQAVVLLVAFLLVSVLGLV
jgi:hypothetical protein